MARDLVIYYSRRGQNYVDGNIVNLNIGNTEKCVDAIRKIVRADLFRVETVKPYPEDYKACTEVAKAELEEDARPELKEYLEDISGYENIFICGPCWWGTFPRAIFSQLERLDWNGKRVLPLMTHEGSGLGDCEADLKRICKGAKFGQGLAIQGKDAARLAKVIAAWASSQASHDWPNA